MSLNEELLVTRNFTIGILLILVVSIYGGVSISYGEGTWFYYETEFESTDSNDYEVSTENYYTFKEIETDGYVRSSGDKADLDEDYDWDDNGFDEREEVITFTKNLVNLSMLLGGALFLLILGFINGYFPKEKSEEYIGYAKNISIAIGVLCLFAVGNFASAYPEAWQDDTDDRLDELCAVEDGDEIPKFALFLGKCENKGTNTIYPPYTGDFTASWHPGPAWFIVLANVLLSAFSYYKIREIEESGLISSYSQKTTKKGISVPPLPPVDPKKEKAADSQKKKGLKFKPKEKMVEVECPGCQAQMLVKKLDKLQEIECKDCGLSGEIEI